MTIFLIAVTDKSPSCGATGALYFGLWLTLPVGLKARMDAPKLALCDFLRYKYFMSNLTVCHT